MIKDAPHSRKTLPSNGGLANPAFAYRRPGTSADLARVFERNQAPVLLRHPRGSHIAERIVLVYPFSGAKHS